MTTNFADISHHQAGVDLDAYKKAGHTRIILKATEGTGFTDPTFAARWKKAGELGLDRVAYHFQRAKFNGADEFDHLYSVVMAAGGLTPRDRLCLDVEDTETPSRAAAGCKEFGARAQARGVTQGLVYTGKWYGQPNGIKATLFPAGWRKLWLSDYTAGQEDAAIELWTGWTRAQVYTRQYTDRASVAGVPGNCDYSHLIKDWLTVVDAVSTTTEDWFDMATQADLEAAVRKVLNEGTAKGQHNWAETEQAELGTVQGNVNRLNTLSGAVAALDAKMSALVAALATASSGQFDLAAVEAAAEKGAAEALARVQLTVAPEAA
jgi:lysozyme